MKNQKKLILLLLFSIIIAPSLFAIDAEEAYQYALQVDQTDEQMEPIGRLNAYFMIMAEEALSTGNMKIVDQLIGFAVVNQKVKGVIIKHLVDFETYTPAYNFVYNNINDTNIYVKNQLCMTLINWGDYNNALIVAESGQLWTVFFKIPHPDMFKIATKAANDQTASYEKRKKAAIYLQREHGDFQTWGTLAREFIETMPSQGLTLEEQRVKVSALDIVMRDDADYIVQNSQNLVNDEIQMIQMKIILFLDYQETQGHPDALAKLLYISENADDYNARVSAKRIYDKHTN